MERGGDPGDGKPQRILKLQMKVEKLKDGLKPILKRLKRCAAPSPPRQAPRPAREYPTRQMISPDPYNLIPRTI